MTPPTSGPSSSIDRALAAIAAEATAREAARAARQERDAAIRDAVERYGMSRRDVADQVGVSLSHVHQVLAYEPRRRTAATQ